MTHFHGYRKPPKMALPVKGCAAGACECPHVCLENRECLAGKLHDALYPPEIVREGLALLMELREHRTALEEKRRAFDTAIARIKRITIGAGVVFFLGILSIVFRVWIRS